MSMIEVAKLAGVSHATVSRVINRRPDVSSVSVRRVEEAMRQLSYVPPAKRRGPKPSASGVRTGNVGLLFFGETPTLAASPVMALVLHAIQDELASRGFNLTLSQVTSAGGLPPNILHGQVDGLLMHGLPPSRTVQRQLDRYSACVWLLSQRRQRGYWGDRVSPDNHQIGALAAGHLIERGHRRIAVIHCDPSHLGFTARVQGFEAAAREAGVASVTIVDAEAQTYIQAASGSIAPYDALIDQLVATRGAGAVPTGLFVPRDALTIRMYRALRLRGLQPGRDIEIVSCDNIPALDALDPRPATIDVRPQEIGRRAVEQLVWRIDHRDAPMNVTTMIEPMLVPGDACEITASDDSIHIQDGSR
ncbi:MAG: LacI family DNA-binding transcriptional regulator [Phycisphaera sp.]|nr:LacI family DNA-binding transcriptional regulator [Phycisphaera sp.]